MAFLAFAAAMGGFLFGYDTAVINGGEQQIQSVWSLSSFVHGLVMSSALWGTVIGAMCGGKVCDWIGRKPTLFWVGVLYLVSAVWSAVAFGPNDLMVARFIGGLRAGDVRLLHVDGAESESDADAEAETLLVDESMTLDELNARVFKPGSRVLFKRGGVWRGHLVAQSGRPGRPIIYGAYSEGPKPVIQPSYARQSPDDWREVKGEGVWKTSTGAAADIGNVVFDHGRNGCAFKRNRLAQLKDDLDFWCDPKTFDVYLKSCANPATRFSSIELCEKVHCIKENKAHDVVYDGLALRYTAAHGIGGGGVKRIVVRNCDISWIGGGYLYFDSFGNGVRFGNGIEFWGAAEDVTVESNRVWECWDAGLTNQSSADDAIQKNISYVGNVVSNCEYSYEYWQQGARAKTENVCVTDNLFVDAGRGWGHRQRWNPNAAHLMFYDTTAETKDFVVANNVFSRSENTLFRFFNDWRGSLTMRGNLWQAGKESICRFHGRPTANLVYRYPDRLDQTHDDNLAEIESQGFGARVFGLDELDAFRLFIGDTPPRR